MDANEREFQIAVEIGLETGEAAGRRGDASSRVGESGVEPPQSEKTRHRSCNLAVGLRGGAPGWDVTPGGSR
jgi:hypothetical protein